MERRRGARLKRRVTCEIDAGGSRHRGIVLDVSPRGLFVQTDATPKLESSVRLRLRVDGEDLDLEARVARKRVVPRQLSSVAASGLGLRIDAAPEAYFRLLAGPATPPPSGAGSTSAPTPPPDDEGVFRVRVKQLHGPRSRSLLVNAPSEEEARGRATADLGEGWSVLEVAPA